MPSITREEAFLVALLKGYDPEDHNAPLVKENWKRVSKAYMSDIASQLSLDACNIWFNSNSPTESGDINLMGGKGDRFFHLQGNADGPFFTIRKCQSMTDLAIGWKRSLDDRTLPKLALLDELRRHL